MPTTPHRDSLACDLMEPIRPQIDAYLLEWICREHLKKDWFFEQRSGNCRLMASLAIRLSETAPTWGRAVAPVAERVAQMLWSFEHKTVRKVSDIKYRPLGNQKCSDLVDGVIYINSDHALNRAVFGATQEDYAKKMDSDRTAQYRACTVITEQSVYRLAEDFYLKNKLLLVQTAPVTSMREFVDAKTDEFAPKLLKILVTAD